MTGQTLVVMGDDSLLVQCCEIALERGNTIARVITRTEAVRKWADGRGLPIEAPGRDLSDRLAGLSFDWLLSIANLSIIPADVLALPLKGAVNFHDGPLPRHAGLNAPVWALIEGETQHGISWHMIEGGVDEGDVLVSRSFDITAADTALTLNTKAFSRGLDSFPDLLDQLESGVLKRSVQDLSQRSYHARDDRPFGHGLLDFGRSAADLDRLLRGLDHGTYWNPLARTKLRSAQGLCLVGALRVVAGEEAAPGTVLAVRADHLTVACAEGAVELSDLATLDGRHLRPADLAQEGGVLPLPTTDETAALTARVRAVAPHLGFWRRRLSDYQPAALAGLADEAPALTARPLAPGVGAAQVALWAARLAGMAACDLAWRDAALAELSVGDVISGWVPLRVIPRGTLADLEGALGAEVARLQKARGFAADLPLRDPTLGALACPGVGLSQGAGAIAGCALTVELGDSPVLHIDTGQIDPALAEVYARRLDALVLAGAETPLADLPQMPEAERQMVLEDWNATAQDHDRSLTMASAFEAQAARTPEATALIFEDRQLSYAELNARANRAAHVLRAMGVVPGTVVGLCLRRSVDLMVGALAILKAGGAYLPMDPGYPADRLQHFVEDSGARVIVTQSAIQPDLPPHAADLLVMDAEPRLGSAPDTPLADGPAPEDIAYLIYTSGSTGKPKGVMVEHRNAVNFFTGMDAVIPHEVGDTWLAVTSLSFDISVLELFWTTARGLTVVLTGDEDRSLISNGPIRMSDAGMQFSLYYWGNDDGAGRDKYKMLLEGAKFADDNGFCAVWTPERHFHAFGGPYPNPSVTGAAVAGVTRNIGVRGGSVVAPLHHPARIAEEWAVIDNLTNGRAGMAIASGWQPDDFVLRPENTPPRNRDAMFENIEQVRRLWRGETVEFPRANGEMHGVVTQPRPVSKELPIWVTTAGNPQTWKQAGEQGCNVLTHLLGQSIDEVADKIKLYHQALRDNGHNPDDFTVTLMLHTYIAETRDAAREVARAPMKAYLTSAANLIKQYAWAFPAFKRPKGVDNAFDLQLDDLDPEDVEAILDFAFERYFNDSGLFGTVEDAVQRTEDLKRIGVTEIACLIDYGIDREVVLEGLRPLARVVHEANADPELAADDHSIAAQILRHGVTHLQCTPSMARMIAMNDEARFALRGVRHLFLGGEPLPGALVEEFAQITQASVTNMYGPTETTIWSSVERASGGDTVVNIGRPLANQQMYVLDEDRAPVPLGAEGELWIGGEGVTRGYWQRPELTAERFVDNPFHGGRMYRTGDLVRRRADGRLDFVGRADHQIKLRGFRIELGEIEAQIEALDGITQAVVMAREDTPGDLRLVAYYTGTAQDEAKLRAALGHELPSFMVPGRLVALERFPLTPNRKVDRKALPVPEVRRAARAAPVAASAPANPVAAAPAAPVAAAPSSAPASAPASEAPAGSSYEPQIAAIWTRVLGVDPISGRDSFFDLGGHSLLAVQAHRAIREELGVAKLSITDIFRFPVLSDLAQRVATFSGGTAAPKRAPAPAAAPAASAPAPQPVVTAPEAAPAPAPAPVSPEPATPAPATPAPAGAQSRADAMARRRAMRARRGS